MEKQSQPTILITGASSGFGLDCATLFLKIGWKVIATLRDAEKRGPSLFDTHPSLILHELDVTKAEAISHTKTLIETTCHGHLDCLINNAGFGVMGIFESLPQDQMKEQIDVNFIGLSHLTQALLPYLRKAQGRIINISSVLGYNGLPLGSLYTASKHAVEGLTESLYYELAPHNVQVALIEPGRHATAFGTNLQCCSPDALECALYTRQMKNYIALLNNRKYTLSGPSHKVASIIYKVCSKKKMPLRTRIGVDAHMGYWLKRLLPNALYYSVLRCIYTHLFTRSCQANEGKLPT